MKRVLPFLLALFLLAGCNGAQTPGQSGTATTQPEATGVYEPESSAEQQSNGALRTYGITGTQVFAARDGVAVLNADGELTVIDTEEGLVLKHRTGITGVLAAGDDSVFYYDTAVHEYNWTTAQAHSWTLPESVQGQIAVGVDTREIYYCMEGSIYALDMDTGLARLIKQHSYTQQTILGAYFGGQLIAWETEAGITYLSSEDGSPVRQEQNIRALYTQEDSYLALRQDGMVEQIIAGQRNGAMQQLNIPAETLYPVFSVNGVVRVDTQIGVKLSYYDLSAGKQTAQVSIGTDKTCLGVVALGEYIWVLTDGALYRWDTSKSAATDETVYTSPVWTAEQPDSEGMAACQDRIKQLNETYGVQIRIGAQAVDVSGEHPLEAEYQIPTISHMLDALEPVLQLLPADFWKTTVQNGQIHICLVRSVNAENGYVRYWENGDCYIAVSWNANMEEALLVGLGGAVETRILGHSRDLEYWHTANPKGFAYGYGQPQPEEYIQFVGVYFPDENAMLNPSEDRARVFCYAVTKGNEELFREPAMQQKLKMLCEGVREAYDLAKSPDVFPWEQYLETPLAYTE